MASIFFGGNFSRKLLYYDMQNQYRFDCNTVKKSLCSRQIIVKNFKLKKIKT
jgi:hypothetical protein